MMCPPGVDQTTRTSPRWQLLSPETQQVLPGYSPPEYIRWGDADILKATFGAKPLFNAWDLLALPVLPNPSSPSPAPLYKFRESSSNFNKLSNEIIDLIYSRILPSKEYSLALALALNSQRIWQILFRRIHRTYISLAAPFAGKSIIFQCSWVTELPPVIKLQKELVAKHAAQGRQHMCEARRFFWKHSDFPSPLTNDSESLAWTSTLKKHLNIRSNLGKYLLTQLRSEIYFPVTEWILRNHTTRQYVTSHHPHPQDGQPDFTTVLMMWNTWGLEGDTDKYLHKFGIGKGQWAGSKLDIVTREVFEEERVGRWEDLTKKVNEVFQAGKDKFEEFQETRR
jgi:hypothetical protein